MVLYPEAEDCIVSLEVVISNLRSIFFEQFQ